MKRLPIPAPPSFHAKLTTVGITGTNGKTSTNAMLAAILTKVASPIPRTTTLGSFLDNERLDLPANYQGFIETMKRGFDRGALYAVIELTSEALARGFAQAWPCSYGVFTNLTHDHLDAHHNFEHYLASKAQLFMHLPSSGAAILNGCDASCELLKEIVPASTTTVFYGSETRGPAIHDLHARARRVSLSWDGTTIDVDLRGIGTSPTLSFRVPLIGHVYAENAIAALAAALVMGVPENLIVDALASMPAPSGRFEVVSTVPYVIVDYAHTPDALTRTLAAARELCTGKLTAVFGAGGHRDKAKRPAMGASSTLADRIILTSDNPRDEDPAAIAAHIREGIPSSSHVEVELDRFKAIRKAMLESSPDDVVVVAGKGHESEQIIGAERRHFSDQDVIRSVATHDQV